MANLQPQIPQRIEHGFNDLLGPSGRLVGRDEGDIDIAVGRHFPAPISTNSKQHYLFALAAIARRIEVVRSRVVQHAQHLIGQKRIGLHHLAPIGGLRLQPAQRLHPALL